MRRIHRAPFARPVAWLLTVALVCGTLLLPARPASAQTNLPSVAVVQVANQSGSSVQNLASRLASALNQKLAASGRFQVLGQNAVDQAIAQAQVRLPLRPDIRDQQLRDLSAAAKSDYLLAVTIDSVEADSARQVAVVKSHAQLYSRLAQGDVTSADITAFNLTRSSNDAVLIDDALDQNALYAVKTLVTNLGVTGTVIAPPIEDTVRISLKEADYLRTDSQFIALRNGVRYALLEFSSAHAGEASTRIIQRDRPDITPATNDQIILYRQGHGALTAQNPDIDPIKDKYTAAEKGHQNWTTLLGAVAGVALLGIGAWAVLSAQSKRTDARTPQLVSPPNNSVLTVNDTNQLTSPVSFTTTGTNSATQFTLQIASDTNFTTLAYSQTAAGTTTTGGTGGTTTGGTGQTAEPVSTAVFTPTGTFLAPGAYFWRVIANVGIGTRTSNVFAFTVVRQGGGGGGTGGTGGALRSPDTVNALSGNASVELQWTPVAGATGYQVWRRVLTPRFANALAKGRTFQPNTGSDLWLRNNGRRSPRAARGARNGFAPSRQTSPGSLAGFTLLASVPATALSYTDSTVQNGTEYQWVVLTVDNNNKPTALDQAQGTSFATTTPLSTTPPATPTNLTATPGDGQVTLTWTPISDSDLAGYQVFRSTSQNGNFVDLTNNLVVDPSSPSAQGLSAGPGQVSVVDRGVTNGVPIFYRIRAVQLSTLVNGVTKGGLTSALSDAVQATPTTAPPQELQVLQPANNTTTDADRPLLAWRGVNGASQYTVQLSTDPNFPAAGLIQTTSTDTELIYPASLPALTQGTKYYVRVGVFDQTTQALRFGNTSSFTRGAVQRFTTTVSTTRGGAPLNGASISIDNAAQTDVTPAQFILSPKANNDPYTISAVFNDIDGTRYSGTVSYRPGIDSAAVTIPLTASGVAPATPTGLTGTGQTDRIVLRWNPDPNLGTGGVVAAEYSIRRRANTAEGPFAEVARVAAPAIADPSSAPQLIYTDFNVSRGVRYYYQIVAISAAGVESLPSVTTNAVAGVGAIQVITPQDNQTFLVQVNANTWTSTIQFGWLAVPSAARYVFEIGTDPNLHQLLANGNRVIAASSQPTTSITLSETAPDGYTWDVANGVNVPLYWRVTAVDESNVILNQTEARKIFQFEPVLVAIPANGR